MQQRERSCDSPAPMFGGLSCDKLELGPSVETKECKKDMCPGEIIMFLEFTMCTCCVSNVTLVFILNFNQGYASCVT